MNIVKNRKIYFIFSGITIGLGAISIILFGLKFSIDFTGGTRIELATKNPSKQMIEGAFTQNNISLHAISIADSTVSIRSDLMSQEQKAKLFEVLKKDYPDLAEKSFETVGPTIGRETQINALKAVLVASVAISMYVAFAFRTVSKPVSSWKYGMTTIITLLHDVLIMVGLFAILGAIFNVEIDSLFITALLTIMGFSVHDTIVVFDRIRENLRKNIDLKFDVVVNNSLLETLNRSLNTSITVLIVLFALFLFGGESIRWFVVALIFGIMVGTYSSIFNAAQILVAWHDWDKKRKPAV